MKLAEDLEPISEHKDLQIYLSSISAIVHGSHQVYLACIYIYMCVLILMKVYYTVHTML